MANHRYGLRGRNKSGFIYLYLYSIHVIWNFLLCTSYKENHTNNPREVLLMDDIFYLLPWINLLWVLFKISHFILPIPCFSSVLFSWFIISVPSLFHPDKKVVSFSNLLSFFSSSPISLSLYILFSKSFSAFVHKVKWWINP